MMQLMSLVFAALVLIPAIAHADDDTAAKSPMLTWQVEADPKDTTGMYQLLALVVSDRGKDTRYDIGRVMGFVTPATQPLCGGAGYARTSSEVAKIVFYEGGATIVAVRKKRGIYWLQRHEQSDGACPDRRGNPTLCPPGKTKTIKRVKLSSSKVQESITLKDNKGQWVPLVCDIADE
jgi:hypothetical protein